MNLDRSFINDVGIYPFSSKDELIEYVEKQNKILIAINAEKILHATNETKIIINDNIGYCDGIGAVLALKKKGFRHAKKIPGCELWLDIIHRFHKEKSFYLIGGKQNIIEATVNKLKQTFENINIVGYRNGYIRSDDEKKELISDIIQKKPEIVFVAMGSPKQEFLMQELHRVNPAIYQGLGGSFDVFTGYAKRAPKWWLEHRLEFAYRLIKQPTRIKRQIHLVRFWFMIQLRKF